MPHSARSLGSDNHSGIHPVILAAIIEANTGHAHSYGKDPWTQATDALFREAFGPQTKNYYAFNGTATNVLCLDSLVQSHQSVLCGTTSHLWQDECGAAQRLIGCQLVAVEPVQGKLTPTLLQKHLVRLGDQHASQPGAFSITQPTELGTVYTLDELAALGEFAQKNRLKFHMDGARLINAAAALGCSLAATSFHAGVDALSFGGTKHGLLHAEAVIFKDDEFSKNFRFRRKQAMQLPSKTRFIAAQFKAFLENKLWQDIGNHANAMATQLRERAQGFTEIKFPYATEASSVFANIPRPWLKELRQTRFFYVWEPETTLVRWSMGFDTNQSDIDELTKVMDALSSTGR